MFLQDRALCLKRSFSGENRLLLELFLRKEGLLRVFARVSRQGAPGREIPDFLGTGEVTVRRKGPDLPAWLQEFSPGVGYPAIARDYRRLQAASRLAAFFAGNLPHLEEFDASWDLLHSALQALETAPVAEVVPLKAVFLFARGEGYPVREGWLARQREQERQALAQALRRPVAECTCRPEKLQHWLEDLFRFLSAETPLLPGK
ncbi:MAG: hypothetical protein GVY10_00585 [Verrucomicrobia bacterium]|jgi:hypothetical protein|nr:hypothetical protein [Verrucomicrobiota bacterium]